MINDFKGKMQDLKDALNFEDINSDINTVRELIFRYHKRTEALEEITKNPWYENALDPQWAGRIAQDALIEKKEGL